MHPEISEFLLALRAHQLQLANAIIDISRLILALSGIGIIASGFLAYYFIDRLPFFLVFLGLTLSCCMLCFWAWIALPEEIDEIF